jgi:hypothetical protein
MSPISVRSNPETDKLMFEATGLFVCLLCSNDNSVIQ